MGTVPSLADVTSWYQVAGLAIIVMATMVVPQVMSILTARRAERSSQRVEKTLTTNNGGSHVKDKLDKLVLGQESQQEHNKLQETMLANQQALLEQHDDRISDLEDLLFFGRKVRPNRFRSRYTRRRDRERGEW